jgi:hypothetical protein
MKYLATTTLLLLMGLSLFAQKQLDHPKRMFQDSDGTIYTHVDLPAYFFVSTQDDGKDMVRMESTNHPDKANPMKWDGQGVHNFKHSDEIDKVEIRFQVNADGQSPETSLAYGAQGYRKGAILHFGQAITPSLKAEDNLSGLDKIYHSINGKAYQAYKPVSFDKEGEYTYRYYAVDRVGNVEEVEEVKFVIDKTTPITQREIVGDRLEDILSARSTIKLIASDALSGLKEIRWKFDENEEQSYRAPIRLNNLSEGQHSLSYYSVDEVGNKEKPQSFTFFLDNTPPIVSEDIIGDFYTFNGRDYASGRTKVRLTALDNKAGVKAIYYQLNDADYKEYSESFYLPKQQGAATLKAYAIDKANNSSKRDNEGKNLRVTYVDLSGPRLSYAFDGPTFTSRDTTFISRASRIRLSATDGESGLNRITYKLSANDSEKTYTEPLSIPKSGVFNMEIFGYDNVNNRNRTGLFFRVDNKGPEIFSRFSIRPLGKSGEAGAEVSVYPKHVVLFLSATDELVGYDKLFYQINEGKEKLYTQPISGFTAGKTYQMKVRALDKLGNESSQSFSFMTEE